MHSSSSPTKNIHWTSASWIKDVSATVQFSQSVDYWLVKYYHWFKIDDWGPDFPTYSLTATTQWFSDWLSEWIMSSATASFTDWHVSSMTQSIFNSQSVSQSVSQPVSQPITGCLACLGINLWDSGQWQDRTSALLTSHCIHWCDLNYAISGNWIKPGWFSQWPVQSLGLDEPAVIEPKSSFITHRSITVLIWVTFNVTKSSHIISKIKIRSTINKCKWFHVWKFHCSNQVRVSIN